MQVDKVLARLERPYIVLLIVVVLLQMAGDIFWWWKALTLQLHLPGNCAEPHEATNFAHL